MTSSRRSASRTARSGTRVPTLQERASGGHVRSSVVYPGTHDNHTVVGSFDDRGDGKASTRTHADPDGGLEIHGEMKRLAMPSVARLAPALERRLLDCSRAYGRAPETKTP